MTFKIIPKHVFGRITLRIVMNFKLGIFCRKKFTDLKFYYKANIREISMYLTDRSMDHNYDTGCKIYFEIPIRLIKAVSR